MFSVEVAAPEFKKKPSPVIVTEFEPLIISATITGMSDWRGSRDIITYFEIVMDFVHTCVYVR